MRRKREGNGLLPASLSLTDTHSAEQKVERTEERDEREKQEFLKEATGCNGIIKAR